MLEYYLGKIIWTRLGLLKFVKNNLIGHIDTKIPCWGSCIGILFLPFYCFIHCVNPVKCISLACLKLNEALVDLNWFGQCSAPSNMCGPVASEFNPFIGGTALKGKLLFHCHSHTETGKTIPISLIHAMTQSMQYIYN